MIIKQGIDGKIGVENIKRLFAILLEFYSIIKGLIKEFKFLNLLQLVTELIKYKDDIDIFKTAWKEFEDLSVAEGEANEITDFLLEEAKKYENLNQNIVLAVKESLGFISEVYDLWKHGVTVYEKGVIVYDKIRSISVKDKIDAD
jgi:hypothetical protein